MTLQFSTNARNAQLAAIAAQVDAGAGPGYIEIRSGTRPANVNTTATGTVLSTITCADPAFETPSAGSMDIDANPDLVDSSADATGTASWARVYDSTGAAVMDGSVATSGADFNITSTAITAGQTVTLLSGSLSTTA